MTDDTSREKGLELGATANHTTDISWTMGGGGLSVCVTDGVCAHVCNKDAEDGQFSIRVKRVHLLCMDVCAHATHCLYLCVCVHVRV